MDTTVLTSAADGIRRAAENQEAVPLQTLSGDLSRYGSTDVHQAFADFCEQWSNGLDVLTKDAQAIADTLIQAASGYRLAEETSERGFADITAQPE